MARTRLDFMKIRNNNGQPKKDFIPYIDAKNWVNRLGFENYRQWLRFAKMRYTKGVLKGRLIRPLFIPANPQCSYAIRNEWINDTDFLGERPTPYVPFEEAKQTALSQKFTSSTHWIKWHRENKIIEIPRYPHVVYPEWTIWADFLGTKSIHHSKRQPWIRFEEAIKILHSIGLKSREEYLQWIKEHPIYNLPVNPNIVYENFPGWSMFLGKTVADKLEVQQNIEASVLYVAHYSYHPSNVYEIKIDKKGKTNTILRSKQQQFNIIKMFSIETSEIETATQIIKSNGSEWWESDNTYIIINIHELLFQLGVLLPSV